MWYTRKQFLTSTLFTSATRLVQQINLKYNSSCTYNMNEAYLRFGKGQETFEFTFRYIDQDLKIDRQFNFQRKASEPVSSFLKRVDVNVGKIISKKKIKKFKKQKKNQETKEDSDDEIQKSMEISLLRNEITIDDDTPCEIAFQNVSQLTLKICESKFSIKQNVPWIEVISLPQSILVGFPTYPSKFLTSFTNIQNSNFTWYKNLLSSTPNKPPVWKEIGKGYFYIPKSDDMGYKLKMSCIPGNEEQIGPCTEIVSPNLVEAGPGRCPFEDRHEFAKNKLTNNRYNKFKI